MSTFEIVVCGAGIAGASLAWQLARTGHGRVLLLEREAQPGYHSTGRSAAMFMESYGPPQVRALTRASRAFYTQPPAGFTDVPLLHPRGVLYLATHDQQALLDETWATMHASGQQVARVGTDEALARVPCLRADRVAGAIAEADAMDLDVHALHQGFLRGARAAGVTLQCDAGLVSGQRDASGWSLALTDGRTLRAEIVVNAAGAWADDLAQRCGVMPLGLEPRRRSAFTFHAPEGTDASCWPAVVAIDESWYFKPDAGRLLGSPANANPTHAHDVQPEELDIALEHPRHRKRDHAADPPPGQHLGRAAHLRTRWRDRHRLRRRRARLLLAGGPRRLRAAECCRSFAAGGVAAVAVADTRHVTAGLAGGRGRLAQRRVTAALRHRNHRDWRPLSGHRGSVARGRRHRLGPPGLQSLETRSSSLLNSVTTAGS